MKSGLIDIVSSTGSTRLFEERYTDLLQSISLHLMLVNSVKYDLHELIFFKLDKSKTILFKCSTFNLKYL